MPPRICSGQPPFNCVEIVRANLVQSSGVQRQASAQCIRSLSSTSTLGRASNSGQRRMRRWLNVIGKEFKNPTPGRPNYLTGKLDQPFPTNPTYISQPVLSERSRTLIWSDIIVKGEGLKEVSAKYGVDVRRVAAVVRLKELEKKWESEGKQLARPYSRVILDMLPRTELADSYERSRGHESTSEVHIRSRTMQQIYLPAPEGRIFTRFDAAKAFGDHVLPIDKTIPIPELIQYESKIAKGVNPEKALASFKNQIRKSEAKIAAREAEKVREAVKNRIRVHGSRVEFRFTQFDSANIGVDGRSPDSIGHRYGAPHLDRQTGRSKVPGHVGPKELSGLV